MPNRARVRARMDGKSSITIEIYDVIDEFAWLWDGQTAKTIRETLAAHPEAEEIHVRINTDGGDVCEGIAMMTALAEHPGRVVTHNDGKAYSMGSLLLLSGDERRMSRGAELMAHLPWTVAVGTSEELRDVADLLDSKAADLAALYAQATGVSEEQWLTWLTDTTWWNADEAMAVPLIDEVTNTVAVRAQLRGDEYPNIPARLLCRADGDKRAPMPPEKRQDKTEPDRDASATRKAERARCARIRAIGEKLGTEQKAIDAAIDDEMTVEDFRAKAVDALEASAPPILPAHGRASITPGDDEADKYQRCLVGRIVELAGMSEKVAKQCKKLDVPFERSPRQYRDKSLYDLVRESLAKAGIKTEGMTRMQTIGHSFTMGGGYDTTGHFPTALEDSLHKMLLAEYLLQEMTWRLFCDTGRLNDFRPHSRYRLSEMGVWQKVNEHGEYQNVPFSDARREQIKADKYGNIVAVTREMIINDDMMTITQQLRAFARGGAFTVELAVYDLLKENAGLGPLMSDGKTLYHADHKNLGTPSALSVAGLEADRVVMRRQTDDSGQRHLNYRPSRMVISTELWAQANVINDSQWDVDAVDTNLTNKFQVPNKVRGMLEIIVDAPEITGTERRIFTDPNIQPVIEAAFLEGVQEPTIERREGWRVDGTEWKGRQEFGVAAVDFNGTVYNAGA